jgi:hypothetical protein
VFNQKMDRKSLTKETGITNEVLLDRLVTLSVSGEGMVAFKLYPLVEIAWASGKVNEREARAVLTGAEKQGIQPGSAAHQMLERRLRKGPSREVRKVWFMYAEELRETLRPQELDQFRRDLLALAKAVCVASGGVLRIAFSVSWDRKLILDAVEKALTA